MIKLPWTQKLALTPFKKHHHRIPDQPFNSTNPPIVQSFKTQFNPPESSSKAQSLSFGPSLVTYRRPVHPTLQGVPRFPDFTALAVSPRSETDSEQRDELVSSLDHLLQPALTTPTFVSPLNLLAVVGPTLLSRHRGRFLFLAFSGSALFQGKQNSRGGRITTAHVDLISPFED